MRQIDEFSGYFVTACVATRDKVTVVGLGTVVGAVGSCADKTDEGSRHPGGNITITLQSGEVRSGSSHDVSKHATFGREVPRLEGGVQTVPGRQSCRVPASECVCVFTYSLTRALTYTRTYLEKRERSVCSDKVAFH